MTEKDQVQEWLQFCSAQIQDGRHNSSVSVQDYNFDMVQQKYNAVYAGRNVKKDGPPIVWRPSPAVLQQSNLQRLMQSLHFHDYNTLHTWSIEHLASFWKIMVTMLNIAFVQHPKPAMLTLGQPKQPEWFAGGQLNIVNSIFQTVTTRDSEDVTDRVAVVWRDEVDSAQSSSSTSAAGELQHMRLSELWCLTNRISNCLKECGFVIGDAIAIDMPMTVECVAIYLAIVQAGMVVVSIADSFATPEIEKRLHIAAAKAVFTVSDHVRGGKCIPMFHKVKQATLIQKQRIIVIQGKHDVSHDLRDGIDMSWQTFLNTTTNAVFVPVTVAPSSITNILFSSGTTGEPKALPWTQLTPIKAAADGYLYQDIKRGDVVCWPTNIGWMMGPWLIYQLINQATIALYNGAPSGEDFGRFVEAAGVTILGTIPTMVKNWKQTKCMETSDWSRIRVFSSTGE